MADVTDAAFRRIIAKYSKVAGSVPYVTWTEFVSADGLALASEEGRRKLLTDLIYSEAERPIVAQFFGSRSEHMEKAAALALELGFDGVDINMGCPDKSIEKQGAGAAHMKDHKRAQEVIAAVKRGAGSLPVSVKTRLGYNKDELEEWLPKLLETGLAAVTIHARTRKEMSAVPAKWDRVKRAVEIRDEIKSNTLILGNGDIADVTDAKNKIAESGADGAMLGRAIFGNPWLFRMEQAHILSEKSSGSEASSSQTFPQAYAPALEERLRVMVEHTKLFEELLPHKSFAIMKKHYKSYVSGFDGAADLRSELMIANDADEVSTIVEHWLGKD
jgi:nifR3 family TIM-barrel protein